MGCWCRRQKRKRAFLGSPQVEIANGCALGGRRGLARPAIEPPLPMPQAINRHKGCLSDESCSWFFSFSASSPRNGFQTTKIHEYLQASQPGGTHPPQAGWLGAIRSHRLQFFKKSATSQPRHCQACQSLNAVQDFL